MGQRRPPVMRVAGWTMDTASAEATLAGRSGRAGDSARVRRSRDLSRPRGPSPGSWTRLDPRSGALPRVWRASTPGGSTHDRPVQHDPTPGRRPSTGSSRGLRSRAGTLGGLRAEGQVANGPPGPRPKGSRPPQGPPGPIAAVGARLQRREATSAERRIGDPGDDPGGRPRRRGAARPPRPSPTRSRQRTPASDAAEPFRLRHRAASDLSAPFRSRCRPRGPTRPAPSRSPRRLTP